MEIVAGKKPAVIYRIPYRPYKKHPKYKGFLALYVHYLYILGKIQKKQYPPRMTAQVRQDVMRFEQLQAQFKFLREHGIETPEQLAEFAADCEETLRRLTKQRTILNVQKKRRQPLFKALSDAESLAPVKPLYEAGLTGMEEEYLRYMEAVRVLDGCGISREMLLAQKSDLYTKLADLNREIRRMRKYVAMCQTIQKEALQIQENNHKVEPERDEVNKHDRKR